MAFNGGKVRSVTVVIVAGQGMRMAAQLVHVARRGVAHDTLAMAIDRVRLSTCTCRMRMRVPCTMAACAPRGNIRACMNVDIMINQACCVHVSRSLAMAHTCVTVHPRSIAA